VYEVPLTAGTLWFGDPSAAYVIGTRAGISSSMSEHVKFNLDQVMWKMTQRFDGINLYSAAGQQAVGIDSALTT
jgi:HK97 family phage major capsid protein